MCVTEKKRPVQIKATADRRRRALLVLMGRIDHIRGWFILITKRPTRKKGQVF